ncbi:META domain-containing protein [Marimonas arenosa]|uniref:META domain-containing protein n=1 Tax=Marimonas arenosa TaxID=1795305 RepID=A0AAE3WDM9_9RHOB|nr:META domain-containing protein [Marimonas arenosa]MDQ2090774.1 META domain-containing protein [Marimonas arenosa]
MKALAAALCLTALPCAAHDSHSPFDAPGVIWRLIELDGKPFRSKAVLEFPEVGTITGECPCNRFRGEMWSAYPWFDPGPLAATRRACPDLADETRFFAALERMTLAEADHELLILTDDEGGAMVFTRAASGE